jgi:4-amino-4-deoxy-L-arabinose transferase-like glycosyltransferase
VKARAALAAAFALIAAQYLWNAAAERAFWGYDEGGHAGYALSIRERGVLPDPLSGWSTFHPPAAHLLAAGAWALAEPLGPRASLVALRLPSLLGVGAVALVVFSLARRGTGSETLAGLAAALSLCVPVAQLSATMIGNEGLCAGFTALALAALYGLQRDPRRMRLAVCAGLCAGLAAATKYTGLWSAATCALPFLRRDLGRRGLAAGAACAATLLAVAGPVYVRNEVLAGTPFPMTRTREPMRGGEVLLTLRPRRVADYVTVPWDCGRYPYVTVVGAGGLWTGINPAMQSVPCLAYAGFWWDPFGVRATRVDPEEGLTWGVLLLYAGLVPTGILALGFARLAARALRSRGRAPEAPLLLLCALGAGSFVGFTWLAPSLAAAKSSYLLPLLAPAGVAFAEGCAALPRPAQRVGTLLSLLAATLALYAFTVGTVFATSSREISLAYWTSVGRALPGSFIGEAARRLLE